jgi:hypothetical protein
MEGLNLLLKNSNAENKLSCIKVSRMFNILHLFFVDDVLILTKDDLQEWLEIDKLIVLFCKASGLQVNVTKTTLHFEGLTNSYLTPFRSFLRYTFSAMDTWFKYLGYHLKTGAQRTSDWNWLLIKMEKKIGL